MQEDRVICPNGPVPDGDRSFCYTEEGKGIHKKVLGQKSSEVFQVEGLLLDDYHRMVMVDEGEVRLTPIEYKILRLLIREQGKVFSSDEIYREVWNMRPVRVENNIAVHVRHIREKIESDPARPQYLKAVWGRGYMVG